MWNPVQFYHKWLQRHPETGKSRPRSLRRMYVRFPRSSRALAGLLRTALSQPDGHTEGVRRSRAHVDSAFLKSRKRMLVNLQDIGLADMGCGPPFLPSSKSNCLLQNLLQFGNETETQFKVQSKKLPSSPCPSPTPEQMPPAGLGRVSTDTHISFSELVY